MPAENLDPRRNLLCSRENADRIAMNMCETTSRAYAVVRTTSRLQPYRVLLSCETDMSDTIECLAV